MIPILAMMMVTSDAETSDASQNCSDNTSVRVFSGTNIAIVGSTFLCSVTVCTNIFCFAVC